MSTKITHGGPGCLRRHGFEIRVFLSCPGARRGRGGATVSLPSAWCGFPVREYLANTYTFVSLSFAYLRSRETPSASVSVPS